MAFQPFYPLPFPYVSRYPYGQNDFNFSEPNAQFVCAGDVYPFRFVTLDEAGLVRQSVSGEWPIAVSQPSTQTGFGPLAGSSGYPIETFGSGFDCWLELGATVRAGRYLVPDDDGKGIEGLMNQNYAAQAYQAGTAGKLIRVRVLRLGPLMPVCYSDWSYEFDYEYGNDCAGPQP